MLNLEESLTHPNDFEAEKASNSYLMSVIAIIVGLPLPIINLIATFMFYLGNRKGTYFVRWHCTQALFSQLLIVIVNGIGLSWTLSILFGSNHVSNIYFGYLFTIITFNIFEFIVTVRATVLTRQGKHYEMWIFGALSNLITKPAK